MDQYFARRLASYAVKCARSAANALPHYHSQDGYILAVFLLIESVRSSFIGFALSRAAAADLSDLPTSLIALARQLESAGIRSFEPFECDQLALLDHANLAGVEKVLIPDEYAQTIFSRCSAFAEQLASELNQSVHAPG
jgi:hypothetical protein